MGLQIKTINLKKDISKELENLKFENEELNSHVIKLKEKKLQRL